MSISVYQMTHVVSLDSMMRYSPAPSLSIVPYRSPHLWEGRRRRREEEVRGGGKRGRRKRDGGRKGGREEEGG